MLVPDLTRYLEYFPGVCGLVRIYRDVRTKFDIRIFMFKPV